VPEILTVCVADGRSAIETSGSGGGQPLPPVYVFLSDVTMILPSSI
jgi:hypothetical protein